MRESTDAKIKALLTPEQQEKWKAFLEKTRGGGRGVQGAVKKAAAPAEQK